MTFADELLAANPQTPGLIVISGTFNGNICNGTIVYVTSDGCFNGNIVTKNLVIAGTVTGNVQVENLKICASGKLYFKNIQYSNLSIEDGGLLIENPTAFDEKYSPALFNVISKESSKQEVMSSEEFVSFNCSY